MVNFFKDNLRISYCELDKHVGLLRINFGTILKNYIFIIVTPNIMIDVVVLMCGPIRTGEGGAAPFIGVHILGEIWPVGGFDTLAESRWEDQIRPHRPVNDINNTTINERTRGRGLERPGDGMAALFLEGGDRKSVG